MSPSLRAHGSLRSLLTGASVLLLAACAGGDDLPATGAPRAASTSIDLLQQAVAAVEAAPLRTVQQINDRNPMGWAGRAHNQYLVAFKQALKLAPRARCEVLDRVLRDGHFLGADTIRFSREARDLFAPPSVARVGCLARTAALDGPGATAFVRPVAFTAASMSGDMTPYFAAMEAAYNEATTAAQYAALVDAIVASAELVLDGDELAAVQTGASIAISSADYWEANILTDYNEIEYLYQTCAYIADEPYQCQNDVSMPAPMTRTGARIIRASYSAGASLMSCSHLLDWKGVAKLDGLAGFSALLATLNPGAGVAAGGTASATGFLGQGLSFYLCVYAS